MENASFVVDRSQLKNSKDWLVTDLGAFENRGNSAQVFTIADGKIVESRYSRGTKSEKKNCRKDSFLYETFLSVTKVQQ